MNDIGKRLAQRAANSEMFKTPNRPDETDKKLDRDMDAQFNLATHTEDIVTISIKQLRPYSKHPFKAYTDEKLNDLAESIRREGLHQPIIIRAVIGVQGYEVLAGHNRVAAVKLLGQRDISAIIRNADDDSSALVVVNTNLKQREKLLPSEKAFAYKLQMEAIIKNGDKPSGIKESSDCAQFELRGKNREILANSLNVDHNEIQRYIRLTYLLPELLDLLDTDKYPIMAGYEISFLDANAQQAVLQYFFHGGSKDKLTLKHAEAIRAAFQEDKSVTAESIAAIIHKPKQKRGSVTVTFSKKALTKQYKLPQDFDIEAFMHAQLAEKFGTI